MIDFNNEENTQTIKIWCCDGCSAVHFKTQNVMLNFTKDEFAELTQNMNEIFQEQFGSLEFYNLINLVAQNDDILLSDSIS